MNGVFLAVSKAREPAWAAGAAFHGLPRLIPWDRTWELLFWCDLAVVNFWGGRMSVWGCAMLKVIPAVCATACHGNGRDFQLLKTY